MEYRIMFPCVFIFISIRLCSKDNPVQASIALSKVLPIIMYRSTGLIEIDGAMEISISTMMLFSLDKESVTRHALGGVNGELISPKVPLRSCRIGAADAVLSEGLHDPVTSSDLRTLFLELFRDEMRLQNIEIPHSPKPLSPAGGYSQQP